MTGWSRQRPPVEGASRPARPLPARIAFVDVETTGLRDDDRVVTLAVIAVATAPGGAPAEALHLAFDPGRRSHGGAEAIHGYNAAVLRHQPSFATHAPQVHGLIHACDAVMAHKAAVDRAFIDRELAMAGLPPIAVPVHCTMALWRSRGMRGGASLDRVAAHYGLARTGTRHSALEDAYLTLRVFFAMKRLSHHPELAALGGLRPHNWAQPPLAAPVASQTHTAKA